MPLRPYRPIFDGEGMIGKSVASFIILLLFFKNFEEKNTKTNNIYCT